MILPVLLFLGATYPVRTAPSDHSLLPPNDALFQDIQKGVTNLHTHLNEILFTTLKPEHNLIYSPLSIYAALSLLYLAASDETKNELSSILQLPSNDQDSEKSAASLGQVFKNVQNNKFAEVSLANGVFFQKDLQIKNPYVKTVEEHLNVEIKQLDFAKGTQITDTINQWISDKTKSRIPKLIQEPLPSQTKIVLANALYFSATWLEKFPTWMKKSENFNTGEKTISVPILTHKKSVPYVNNSTLQFQAIAVPYEGKEFYLGIVLPYVNQTLSNLVNTLSPEAYQQLFRDLSQPDSYVHYTIPKLKFKWQRSLNGDLRRIGFKKIFQNAQLNNLSDEENLAVSDVAHAAEIEINESGTVASAATSILATKTAGEWHFTDPIPFYVNRPFLFFIYQPKTNVVLFSGAVQNPLAA